MSPGMKIPWMDINFPGKYIQNMKSLKPKPNRIIPTTCQHTNNSMVHGGKVPSLARRIPKLSFD